METEEGVFKIEGGETEYDDYYKAVRVAEAKAEDEERSVTVYRKLINSFDAVVKIFPDGSQESLEG